MRNVVHVETINNSRRFIFYCQSPQPTTLLMLIIQTSIRTLSIYLMVLLLAACSGSNDSSPTSTILGNATKGVIDQGIINAYELRDGEAFFVEATRTNKDGNFSLSINASHNKLLLLELTADANTKMKCDLPEGCTLPVSGDHTEFGQWLSLPASFNLLGVMLPGQASRINISPLSHLIVTTAAELENGLTTANLETANAWLQADLHLNHDPLTTYTADLTSLSVGVDQYELEQGALSASFFSLALTTQWQSKLFNLDDLDLHEFFSRTADVAQNLALLYAQSEPQLDAQLSSIASSAADIADSIDNDVPVISVQPQSSSVMVGEPITLRVAATGLTQESVQWYKDNNALFGENSDTLSISSAQTSDQGLYHAVVSDASHTLRSLSALITVHEQQLPLTVAQQPSSYSLAPGQNAILTVIVSGGTGSYTYVWQKGGSIIPGASSNQLELLNVTENDAGSYRVTISDSTSSVTSNFASISVTSSVLPVTIHQHPESVTSIEGAELRLSVNASGGGFLTYQWRKDGSNLANQNTNTLTINPSQVSDSGIYDVRVSNSQGTVISNSSLVTILSTVVPLSITQQPQSISLSEGGSGSFSVEAEAGSPLTYQWHLNGIPVNGATNSRYDITNADLQDAGAYHVEIQSSTETASSLTALLTVNLAADLNLSWDIPTQRENGDTLSLIEISGYIVQYGTEYGNYTSTVEVHGGSTTALLVEGLLPETYYFRIATIDSDGLTGAFSDPITIVIP
jgi:hypothetical protein